MTYRTDWSDPKGHFWVVIGEGGSSRCWFCGCRPNVRKAVKRCERNPEA